MGTNFAPDNSITCDSVANKALSSMHPYFLTLPSILVLALAIS